MNLAEVPNSVTPCSSARSKRADGGCDGDPSYRIRVAPEASPEASQFHIIQPAVVK